MSKERVLVGIAGGSASGKTEFARQLRAELGSDAVSVLALDSYYRCMAHLPFAERAVKNYDHPEAFDFELLLEHVLELRRGGHIVIPDYDFSTYARLNSGTPLAAAKYIVVEGILALSHGKLSGLFDLKLFIDASDETRLQRRMNRDMRERGRTRDSVLEQWESTVLPMHRAFCEPARSRADLVINGETDFRGALKSVLVRLA